MNHIDFYNDHCNSPLQLKPLPDYDLESQARWILSGKGYHWIELDVQFDTQQWQLESQLANGHYVGHRDEATGEGTHKGWESCALHGIGTQYTNVWQTYGYDKEPDYNWTDLGVRCKNIKNFFDNEFPVDSYARIRFMKLQAGGWISPHNDYNPVIDMNNILNAPLPINIAVDHPDDCHMTLAGQGCVPFQSGKMFMVNIFNYHSVFNKSNKDRIHIIAHCYLGDKKEEFCKLLVESYQKQHEYISSQI